MCRVAWTVMATFKVTLAYDGTGFVGWQRQASGTSIQGLLEDALRELDQRDVAVVGAGRTDAGVHALGQVASFTLNRAIDGDVLAPCRERAAARERAGRRRRSRRRDLPRAVRRDPARCTATGSGTRRS